MGIDIDREMTWLLRELERSYGERDLVALVECFSHEAQVTAFGTDAAEKCTGLADLERQFLRDWQRFDAGTLAHTWMAINHHAGVVWAAADITARFTAGDATWSGQVRSTTVAIPENGGLRIVHWHVSAPADIAG
jgi:hypothetical protein